MVEVKYLVFSNFPLVSTKFSFMEEDWAQRYNFMQFWDFTDISEFPKVLSLGICPL